MTLTIEHGATGSLSTLKKTHKSTNPNGNSNSNHGDDDNDDDNNNQVRSLFTETLTALVGHLLFYRVDLIISTP